MAPGVLCAATVVFMSGCSNLSGNWFAENERTVATSVASLMNPFGIMISFNNIWFPSPDEGGQAERSVGII